MVQARLKELPSFLQKSRKSVVLASYWESKYFKCGLVLRSWCKMGGVADSSDLNHCEEGSIPCFTWMLQFSVFQYDSLRAQVTQCGHRDITPGAVLMVTHVGTCECYLTLAPSRAYCSDRT